jgi:hypothetical protein
MVMDRVSNKFGIVSRTEFTMWAIQQNSGFYFYWEHFIFATPFFLELAELHVYVRAFGGPSPPHFGGAQRPPNGLRYWRGD